MSSRAPRPPLTQRLRLVHWVMLDCLVAVGCGGFVLLMIVLPGGRSASAVPDLGWVVVPLVVFVAVGFRRLRPMLAYAAVLAAAMAGGHGDSATTLVLFLPAAYVLYTVVVTYSRRTGLAALGVVLALITAWMLAGGAGREQRSPDVQAATPVALAMILAWMIGYSVRQRRAYAAMLRQQAAASAVAEERLRIARELHDVVAHSMSVIAVQAGFGQYVIGSDVEGARSALDAIQETSRDALDELRRMLGVLRRQDARRDSAAPLAPACGLRDLARLVERTRGAGVTVSLRQNGVIPELPAGIELSAYRVVQEALTNVVKHAGSGATCQISLGYDGETLSLSVTDDGGYRKSEGLSAADPSGQNHHGIVGMRERIALCGGTFSVGPLPGGGFAVAAWIPAAADALTGPS